MKNSKFKYLIKQMTYKTLWNGFFTRKSLDYRKKQKYLFVRAMQVLKKP